MRLRTEFLERRDLLTADLVADINQVTSQSSNPRDFTDLGDLTLFVADSEVGTELWKTDGTENGTVLVKDIEPGPSGSHPTNLVPLNGVLLFHVGESVWRTDGSEDGTFQLAPTARILLSNGAHAILTDGSLTDGTLDTTRAIEGIRTPIDTDSALDLLATDNELFLRVNTNFYSVDPATGIADRLPGRTFVIRVGDEVFVLSRDDTQMRMRPLGSEESDGFLIPISSRTEPLATIDANGITYFQVNVGGDAQLWRTDGSEPGTFVVRTFKGDGPFETAVAGSRPGELWFLAFDEFGEELWRSDGTIDGTGRVTDIFRGVLGSRPEDFIVQDELWFTANDGINGRQIWKSDGTEAGTVRVSMLPGSIGSDSPEPTLLAVGNKAYFRADGREGVELRAIDRDTLVVSRLKDIQPGVAGSYPSRFHEMNDGTMLFSATGVEGTEVWTTDGTPTGTTLLKNIADGIETGSSFPNGFVEFNRQLYFIASDGIHGSELWRFDGTDTHLVSDIHPGPLGSAPKELVAAGNTLYFSADNGVSRELWMIRAHQPDNVARVVDTVREPIGGNPDQLVALQDRVYFVANLGNDTASSPSSNSFLRHRALWSTNGNDARLEYETAGVEPRSGPSEISFLTAFDDRLYFYDSDTNGRSIRIVMLTPTPGDEQTFEVINETSSRSLNDGQTIQTNQDYLIFTGNNEEARGGGSFWVVTKENPDPVPVPWSERFFDEDTTIAVGDQFLYRGRRGRSFLIDGLTATATEFRGLNEVIAEGTKVGNRTFISTGTSSTQRVQTIDLATRELDEVHRIRSRFGLPAEQPRELIEWQGDLHYVVDDPLTDVGSQVWRIDGNLKVEMITNIGTDSQASSLFVFNDDLYFTANDGERGVELWRLAAGARSLAGDFNDDGRIDVADIDLLLAGLRSQDVARFDLDNNEMLNLEDLDVLVEDILNTQIGDVNLDGTLEFADFLVISNAFGEERSSWSEGDLDGDGLVGFSDFTLLADNFLL